MACRVFDAGQKGQGLKAAEDITAGSLVIEYVGEFMYFCSLLVCTKSAAFKARDTKAASTMALAFVQHIAAASKAAVKDFGSSTASHAAYIRCR